MMGHTPDQLMITRMASSVSGWYGIPAGAFRELQRRTALRINELGEWSKDRYQTILQQHASVPVNDPRYHHLNQRKSTTDLIRLSAAVAGIEFCYAAETAFVTPTLLKIGIPVVYMTLIWCLSPVIGFFLVPFLGSCSDNCSSWLGRRRPFILLLSIGIIIGLILVPHGVDIACGWEEIGNTSSIIPINYGTATFPNLTACGLGVLLTICGVMMLDLCADSCQSPARAYLLDVCIKEDHARGLSMFTAMAGLGGGMGYALGAIHWENTWIGTAVGGQEAAVFLMVLLIYVLCLLATITSFKEMPLKDLKVLESARRESLRNTIFDIDESEQLGFANQETGISDLATLIDGGLSDERPVTVSDYLWSIIFMPSSLRILCLTNLFCWMSLVCYSLYFTDFVGQSVFGGDPSVPSNLELGLRYQEGVRFGCWGMAIYSISCSCYSSVIERLIVKWGAKPVYIGGQLLYAVGMILMAVLRNKACVIMFSATAGVMYSTLFTMPFFLVAHYHTCGLFEEEQPISVDAVKRRKHVRGLGTDVATVSSMVFLAQFILSSVNGSLVHSTGTPTSTIILSALLSFCGALTAARITYLDL